MMKIDRLFKDHGGASELARKLGYSRQRVWRWKSSGKVGLDSVRRVSTLCNIPLHELRPDIYPQPERTT